MEPVTFSTEDGVRLEGELRLPEGAATRERRRSAIRIRATAGARTTRSSGRSATSSHSAGFAVLSFNFRGVMGSGGTFGGGRDEVRDARAAIGRVRDEAPDLPTVVCGWSFGANVALRETLG